MILLPKESIWDAVHVNEVISRDFLKSPYCVHQVTSYQRTDYRPGPGWMSDSYEGFVCVHCGKIITEEKVY